MYVHYQVDAHCSFSRNPLEVTDEFIQQYNNAKNLGEQDRLEKMAKKMLERAKVKRTCLRFSLTNTISFFLNKKLQV